MKFPFKFTIFCLLVLALFAGCDKEYASIDEVDEEKIQNYIRAENLNLIKDSSGIYYQVISAGSGAKPKNSEIVFYTYTAKSIDGKEYFTSNSYISSSNYLGYVRPEGWRLALNKINKGGTIRVVMPSTLGFGRNGNMVFDGNAVLDSELELFDVNTQAAVDDILINRFITKKALTGFSKLPGGVYYNIVTPGSGTDSVTLTSTVTVAYEGRLLNGTVFDRATVAKPFTSSLQTLIEGWKDAVPLLRKGGKIRLLIPSEKGYGSQGSGIAIPPNSVLDFDIELTEVKNE